MVGLITDEELLAIIEDHLRTTGMTPSRFSLEVGNDGALVLDMRRGRSVTLRMANKIAAALDKTKMEAR